MVHIQGGRFIDHIELLQVTNTISLRPPFRLSILPTLDWAGQEVTDLEVQDAILESEGPQWTWVLVTATGDTSRMRYRIMGDTLLGTLETSDSVSSPVVYDLFGVRVPTGALTGRSGISPAPDLSGTTPVVLVELDDDPATDRNFLVRLSSRALTAMIAVPTEFVGREGRPGWKELRGWSERGFGLAAHSRWHSPSTRDGPGFASEVIGSLGTMSAQRLPTGVFVQPGNWPEALKFDSLSKFRTWRGSMLRTFTCAFEAGFRPGSVTDLTDSMAFGFGHWTISDGASPSTILQLWRRAQEPGRFTIFLVHTWRLSEPDALDWFLDTLGVAQAAGRITVARSVTDVLHGRCGAIP